MANDPKTHALHSLEEVPDGKTIGEVYPVFANVKRVLRVGKTSKVCAACRKPFGPVRKARREIRLYPVEAVMPVAWAYPVCGYCAAQHQRGGSERDAVLASVEAFHYGEQANQ